MKVLLLHPEDQFSRRDAGKWDLVVDFGRAPVSTYDKWKRLAGCRVISLYDFALEVEDLYHARETFTTRDGPLGGSDGDRLVGHPFVGNRSPIAATHAGASAGG